MRHLSFSNVIAALALFVALGGTTWAVTKNSVKSKHIVDGTVKSADIKDGKVKSIDLADGGVKSIDLADGGVTSADLADGSVRTGHVLDETLTGDDIEDETLTGDDIDDGSLGAREIGALPHGRISTGDAQTFSHNTIEPVVMDRIDYSLGVGFNFTANDSEIVIDRPGIYLVIGEIIWLANAAGHRRTMLSKNSTAVHFGDDSRPPAPLPNPTMHRSVAIDQFEAGDTIELRALQTSGADLDSGLAQGRRASLTVHWLGPGIAGVR